MGRATQRVGGRVEWVTARKPFIRGSQIGEVDEHPRSVAWNF